MGELHELIHEKPRARGGLHGGSMGGLHELIHEKPATAKTVTKKAAKEGRQKEVHVAGRSQKGKE